MRGLVAQGRQGGRARPARQRRRPAQRGRRRLLASSSPRARSSPRAGARGPSSVFEATGDAISTKIPVAVLVNRESASASEIVTGALQDRDRATVVGTRTFGKGVFQEIKQLSNGGALDITVGEYFTPSGRNLGGGGPKQRRRHHARRQGAGQRQDQARRGARRRRAQPRCAGTRERARRAPVVARPREARPVLHRRPRSSRAGAGINLDKPPREMRAGDLVLVRADRLARRPRQGRAAARAARTPRATCSRR